MPRNLALRVYALLLAGALAGCAGKEVVSRGDPLEGVNRAIFSVNDTLDKYALTPVAETYRDYLPAPIRTGIRNFFANLDDLWVGANSLLQGKVGDALNDWMRVVINTSFGIGGLFDTASDAGLEKHNEDFGQTLASWGLASGPYLVLPLFGPSTLRDGAAYLTIDARAGPLPLFADAVTNAHEVALRNTLAATSNISFRASALDSVNLLERAALDRYAFAREAFMQRRRYLIHDGAPPREPDPED
ncbi:MAG: VacJ family lipoprotein [Burkholderiales bacterium]